MDIGTIPTLLDYAIYDAQQMLIATNMGERELAYATAFAVRKDANGTPYVLQGRVLYWKGQAAGETIVLRILERPQYRQESLRAKLPNPERLWEVFTVLGGIVGLVATTLWTAKRLKKELSNLEQVAEKIGGGNLEFEPQFTRIREFNQVMDSMSLMRDALRDSLRKEWEGQQRKREQMSALAHDIKTPLTVIRGNAELLAEEELSEEQRSYVDDILSNGEQIQDYVVKIMEISRDAPRQQEQSPAGGQSVSKVATDSDLADQASDHGKEKRYDMEEIVKDVADNLQGTLKGKELSLNLHMESLVDVEEQRAVHGEVAERLTRILNNLLDNAIRFSPQFGVIDLEVKREERSYIIQVIDDGMGFTGEDLRYAQEMFYQADKSRTDRTHFGLGLSIVRQLAEELGGTLLLSNVKGRGACVTVKLPACKF